MPTVLGQMNFPCQEGVWYLNEIWAEKHAVGCQEVGNSYCGPFEGGSADENLDP